MAGNQNPFHGAEVNDIPNLVVSISQVNSGTIALIGTAPGVAPGISQVSSADDAAAFGASVFDGRTIPHALDAILAQGVSSVIVINCATDGHLADIANEATHIDASFKVALAHYPVGNIVVKTTGEAPVTLQPGVDYDHNDGERVLTILTRRTYPANTNLTVSYSWFNKALVEPADIVGGKDADTGLRSGIALLDEAFNRYFITPKILIAPIYVEIETVCEALDEQALKLKGRVIVDGAAGLTVDQAIASRGPLGTYVNFDTVSERRMLVYPYVSKPDPVNAITNADGSVTIPTQPFPLSAYVAGLWSASIFNNGIQQSPSNLPLLGFTKTEVSITCGISDRDSDAARLNKVGINTIFSGFAQGVRAWGNRNSSYPNSIGSASFLSAQLTRDIMDENMLLVAFAFQDRTLNSAWVTMALSALTGVINNMILSKALIGGEAFYDKTKNPAANLQAGKVVLGTKHLAPSAAEWIVIENEIDTTLYNTIG